MARGDGRQTHRDRAPRQPRAEASSLKGLVVRTVVVGVAPGAHSVCFERLFFVLSLPTLLSFSYFLLFFSARSSSGSGM